MAKGNRQNWDYYLNMNWIEFDNYVDYWTMKNKEKARAFNNPKSYEDVIIKQLNQIING